MYDHYFSNFVDLPSPMTYANIQPQDILGFGEDFFKGFYHIWAWRPFWSMDGNYFSNLSFPCPREVPNEIRGRLAQRLQRRSHLKVWTFFPYKCIGKQNWPCRKKVNCQCTTIILAIFVDLRSPMICAKIQPQGILGSGEEDFKGFYYIWAWRPSWSTDRDYFSNRLFPKSKEAPYEIWVKLAQGL